MLLSVLFPQDAPACPDPTDDYVCAVATAAHLCLVATDAYVYPIVKCSHNSFIGIFVVPAIFSLYLTEKELLPKKDRNIKKSCSTR